MRILCLPVLMMGCTRKPSLFGFWEVRELRLTDAAGELRQKDYGSFEFFSDPPQDGGDLMVIARYTYSADRAGFAPAAQPLVYSLDTDLSENSDPFEGYMEEGEVFVVTLGADPYEVQDYTGTSCRLVATAANRPTEEGLSAEATIKIPMTYSLER
jgi:hypothetical protein